MSSYIRVESDVVDTEGKRGREGGDKEDRPGLQSGQTGVWEQGRHREARGPSRRVPVIRAGRMGGGLSIKRKFTHSCLSGQNRQRTCTCWEGRTQDDQKAIKTGELIDKTMTRDQTHPEPTQRQE